MYSAKKRSFIEYARGKDKLSERDYKILYRYSYDLDYWLRCDVAELLCDHYTLKAEEVLRRLTYDLSYIVKLNAIDSLCIGRSERTLRRLYILTKSKDELIRMYAYMSYNDVVKNRNNLRENQSYIMWVQNAVRRDPSDKVKLSMYGELYKSGIQSAFSQFEKAVEKIVKERKVNEVWLAINVLEEISESGGCEGERITEILESLRGIANQKQTERIEKILQEMR